MATTRVRRRGDIAATPTWARWRRRGRCGGRSTRRYVGACMNSMAGAVAPTSSFAGADTSPSRAGCTCPRARAQRSSFSPGVSLRSTPGYLHAPLPGCWVSACERSPCSAFGYPRPNTVIPREPFDRLRANPSTCPRSGPLGARARERIQRIVERIMHAHRENHKRFHLADTRPFEQPTPGITKGTPTIYAKTNTPGPTSPGERLRAGP